MSGKRVNTGARIVLGGKDISDTVTRWQVGADVNELYVAEIDVLDTEVIEIVQADSVGHSLARMTAKNGAEVIHTGIRFGSDDQILIGGSDVSSWITRYDRIVSVGKSDIVRLYVQCDSDVLSINGTHPWEQEGS